MRRYGLVACAAQLGIVGIAAAAGCSARALDPGIPVEPTHDASPAPAHDASHPQPQDASPASPEVPMMPPPMPGEDAGVDTSGTDTSAIPLDIDAWIAFDSDGGAGNRDIYVIRADGTGRRRLTTEASTDAQPSFSRDGTKLAFASDRERGVMQIYVMDLATGVATRVTQRTDGAHDPAFTMDGTRVGYRSGISVFTAMLDGTDERQITDGKTCCTSGPFGAPVFTSDGQWTIYDDYNAIYLTTGPTYTRRTIVMPTTGEQSHPTLSPDGARIIVQSTCFPDAPARSLWTVPATGTTNYSCSGGQRISAPGADATHASWGPSDVIVWGSVAGGTNGSSPVPSALVTWQDGTLRPLTSGSGDDRNPSWSPTGTVIGDW
jgi:Tol biopolymer transport system component